MAEHKFSPSRRSAVSRFQVMDIVGDVDAMKAQGIDVISLGAGEPSGGAPAAVNRAAAKLHSQDDPDRKSTRLNSSHVAISYAVFCLKKKKQNESRKTRLTERQAIRRRGTQETTTKRNKH